MTPQYFSVGLRTLIAKEIAKKYGADAWTHLITTFESHELCAERWAWQWRMKRCQPFGVSSGQVHAETGKNSFDPSRMLS